MKVVGPLRHLDQLRADVGLKEQGTKVQVVVDGAVIHVSSVGPQAPPQSYYCCCRSCRVLPQQDGVGGVVDALENHL